jgi:hypothetical protein
VDSSVLNFPILDENGIPVPDSWYTAKDTGALSFFAEEPCPDCGKCRRFYVEGLRCFGCANPPAPKWGDTAPNLGTALARRFSHYTPAERCPTHPHSHYRTSTQLCVACESAGASAAQAERKRQREAEEAANRAVVRKAQAEERARWKAETAEAKAAERSLRVITRTVRTRKGSAKTLVRAAAMVESLTPKPKRKRAATPASPATAAPRSSVRGKHRGKARIEGSN